MATITDSISNLISSIFGVFQSILDTILSAFQSVFALAKDLITSIFDLMSGLVGFLLGNIVIIGVIIAAYVAYSAYRQKNQGGGITGGKKRS